MTATSIAAAAIIGGLGLVHSVFGERLILRRTDPRALPVFLASSRASFGAIRFTWHAMTAAWWGLAALLVLVPDDGVRTTSLVVGTLFGVMGVATAALSRLRHPAWIGMLAVAALLLPTW